ncbi:hypothetical protein QN355_09715 [Cryobacterium sp. 10S3]|uniref:hypothetical protein n=1 Tax=Cryobacterium sp. 10S3 TaxID=3048582 RepID=UPI002AC9963E|nr:hypothetical protein [Cryobacterium sp. 10S3]MEB0286825.1 hypothetical protein [Cryobacterium sp. 10S3]WPX14088.1 hypothetical protein RHM57_01580 [Cryobacterium sp. 10S3]
MAAVLTVPTFVTPVDSAAAVTGSQFQPGNIISDQVFFNTQTMSEADIQAFLVGKESACNAGYTCLKDYRMDTVSRAAVAPGHCAAYDGVPNELASSIIYKAAQACGINPQVLLVLLQKETSLVSSSSPTASTYRKAAGYGCPDTSNCDAAFYGFYNQVYKAAWQFRQYTNFPARTYAIGPTRIQWSPDASCGASTVTIENQATANLYNYTPYQPNGASLASLYTTGDNCSSYGNRNFWVFFNNWFGPSTTALGSPVGQVKEIWATNNMINMWGWAVDGSASSNALAIHVKVNDQWVAWTADAPNSTAETMYPGAGQNHGFGGSIAVPQAGPYSVCVFAVNQGVGENTQLGCYNITVPDGSPAGELKDVFSSPGSVSLWGWGLDPDTTNPIQIHVTVNGIWTVLQANSPSTASLGTYPASGSNHGFGGVIPAAGGPATVCVYAVNIGAGSNTTLGCRTVVVPSGSPIGVMSDMWTTPNGISMWGWALDPDTVAAIPVHVTVDGVWTVFTADAANAGVGQAYPAYGPNHGFGGTIKATPGKHTVCAWGVNQGLGANLALGCRTVMVLSGSPVGALNQVWGTAGGVSMWGWALDPDQTGPIPVQVRIDGQWTVLSANSANAAVGAAYPGYGPNHGFGATIAAAPGAHEVCAWGINVASGANLNFGCQTIIVPAAPSGPPVGLVQDLWATAGTVESWGWAIDPDSTGPVTVIVTVNGTKTTVVADAPSAAAAAQMPGYGANHGYGIRIPAQTGSNDVCVTAQNIGAGADTPLLCRTITVP